MRSGRRRWFETRDDAAARYLRVAGLAGLFDAGAPVVDAGLRQEDGRWRLAMDPRTFAVGAPDMDALIARSAAEVVLARGEHDPMNDNDQYLALGVPTVAVPGLGHNAHVEDPDAVYALLGSTGQVHEHLHLHLRLAAPAGLV